MRPSFIVSCISGVIIFIAFIIFIFYTISINKDEKIFKNIILLSLLGIGIGIHGISHVYEEVYFDFNPLINKWQINDEPSFKNAIVNDKSFILKDGSDNVINSGSYHNIISKKNGLYTLYSPERYKIEENKINSEIDEQAIEEVYHPASLIFKIRS